MVAHAMHACPGRCGGGAEVHPWDARAVRVEGDSRAQGDLAGGVGAAAVGRSGVALRHSRRVGRAPTVLLLDEATSQLDAENESLMSEVVVRLSERTAVFWVAILIGLFIAFWGVLLAVFKGRDTK